MILAGSASIRSMTPRTKGLAMLVLDDLHIVQIHPKGVAHPAKALLDEVGGFSHLI
jgi:hypothetical protein